MTDEELCGWLRSMLPASGFAPTENWAPWLGADRIEALSAENERLREALKDALSHCYNCSGDPHYIEEDETTGDHLWTDCPVCRSARAALGEQQ